MTNVFMTARTSLEWLKKTINEIPEELISEYNGKQYVNLTINTLREEDSRGNTHYLAISYPSKEAKASGVKPKSICSFKEWDMSSRNNGHSTQQPKSEPRVKPEEIGHNSSDYDDLPF